MATEKRYVRFKGKTGGPAWGLLSGDKVRKIKGNIFGKHAPEGRGVKLSSVKLLAPVAPPKIFAIGLNYKSHLGTRSAPKQPEVFYKPVTCVQNPGDPIVLPPNSNNVHYEGELVLVIGKTATRISKEQAPDHIFGVTCGDDVSERDWQNGAEKDLQWWRAKGSDTFGPCGPVVVTAIDYGKLLLQTRVNGEVVQKQYTSDLLFSPAEIVSYISQNVTLQPGDLVFTGTPGTTQKLKPGDVVEVEIEGIGVLRNPVVAG